MTTFYFIRHAEKEHNTSRNPHLTVKGQKMAEKWKAILMCKGIEAIYCTSLIRTRETALPLAEELGLQIQTYNPGNLFIERFKAKNKGKTVLIVGHQDTTPRFVNAILKQQKYGFISAENHGNLYEIQLDEKGIIKDQLLHYEF